MTRRRRPLPPQPCSLTDETGNHDVARMNATRSKGRVTYLCPECGFHVTLQDEGEASETPTEKPSADPEPEPPKKTPEKEEPEPKPRKGGRGKTEAFRDGATITMEGHAHTLHEVTIRWDNDVSLTFYEIYREDGEYIGRVSQSVSWKRTENLIYRAYHPETERYPAGGITWTGRIRALREPKKNRKKDEEQPNPTLYVTIPKASVDRFRIMTDDEVSVRVGDCRPDSKDEWYHVSEMSGSKIVVISKLKRMVEKGETEPIPEIGEYVTIRMEAHPKTGRRNLCHWSEEALELARNGEVGISHPSLNEDLKPRTPEPERKVNGTEPEPEEEENEAVTVFNDF